MAVADMRRGLEALPPYDLNLILETACLFGVPGVARVFALSRVGVWCVVSLLRRWLGRYLRSRDLPSPVFHLISLC